jgi:CxxC-x17-CxxC domain-containing protein
MGFERKMYDVSSMNLKCAQCSKAITELPFQPDGNRPVYCQQCNRGRARSGGFRSGGYNRGGGYRGR